MPVPVTEYVPTLTRSVRWWAVVSSVVAPVAMIGGWTAAAARQPAGFSSIRQTISTLAGLGATDRGIMTAGLLLVGGCHLVTAAGLDPAQPRGRLVLASGGLATAAVAALPLPAQGSSRAHGIAALIAFLALALWPLAAARANGPSPVLRPPVAAIATAVLIGLLIITGTQLRGGDHIGLAERLLAGAESLWPAVVTLATPYRGRPSVS